MIAINAWIKKGLLISPFLSLAIIAHAGEIYRYQDAQGKWHYSDKKRHAGAKASVLHYQKSDNDGEKPFLSVEKTDNNRELYIHNPYFGPVYAWLDIPSKKAWLKLAPNSKQRINKNFTDRLNRKHFYFVLGENLENPEEWDYQLPIQLKHGVKISQSFNGRFSHNNPQNQYAVDFAADVGTDIVAARAGTVMLVKDNYPMAGTDAFFIDKANRIVVLHKDGTLGVYAHILLGSASVKAGDIVAIGDKLAEVGSNGFSTGPHLHFVIWYNKRGKQQSLPFWFNANKSRLQPKAGDYLTPN